MNLQALLDRIEALARHEAQALVAHREALHQRWRVARRTRTAAELLRHQLDLLPLTMQRLGNDHQRRIALLRALLRGPDCSDPSN